MSRIEEMKLEDLTKELIKDDIHKLEGYRGEGSSFAYDIAERILRVHDNSALNLNCIIYDVKRGLEFITNNALCFEKIYFIWKERGSEINPLHYIDTCMIDALVYSIEETLSGTSYIQKHKKHKDVELTSEGIEEILEYLGLENERGYER